MLCNQQRATEALKGRRGGEIVVLVDQRAGSMGRGVKKEPKAERQMVL
jgi:hypothetical protein